MRLTRFLIFLGLIVLASCKKDPLPHQQSGDPVFVSNFEFDGTNFELAAGVNGLVMQPSTTETDTSITFISELNSPDCVDCGPGLELTVHSPMGLDPSTVMDWLVEAESWTYDMYQDSGDTTFAMRLNVNPGNDFSTGNWFLNGSQLNFAPENDFEIDITDPGSYEINFEVDGPGCLEALPRTIFYDGINPPCYANVETTFFNPFLITATLGENFNPDSVLYTWTYDTVTVGPASDPELLINSSPAEPIDEVCLEVTDLSVNGCSDSFCFAFGGAIFDCAPVITIESTDFVPISVDPFTGALTELVYTDESGNQYSSDPEQDVNSSVQLVSIEQYSEPANPTSSFAKIVFEITTILFDESSQGFPFSGRVEVAWEVP